LESWESILEPKNIIFLSNSDQDAGEPNQRGFKRIRKPDPKKNYEVELKSVREILESLLHSTITRNEKEF